MQLMRRQANRLAERSPEMKGIRLFYPISSRLFNFGIFPNVVKSNWAEVFSFHNLLVIGFETALFLVPVFLVYRREFAGYLKEKQWWKI